MSVAMQEEQEQKSTDPTYWECSKCGNWVVIYVTPSSPPCCNNPRHSTRVVIMEKKRAPRGRIQK